MLKRTYILICLFLIANLTVQSNSNRDNEKTQHITVRFEKGKFFGWPANCGIWSWGNEILIQYKSGDFIDKPVGSHDIDLSKPVLIEQSRSTDGGITWCHEKVTIAETEHTKSPLNAAQLTTPIDFSDPNTILRFEMAGYLYFSNDRGRNWQGPFQLPLFGKQSAQLRTDYIITDNKTCLAFGAFTNKQIENGENGSMTYMMKTIDGGLSWTLETQVGRIVNPKKNFLDIAIMPSTVKIGDNTLVSCIRNLKIDRPGPKVAWIECYRSNNLGKHWKPVSIPVASEAGTTPPALTKLQNGTLLLTYGYRKPIGGPTSIRAKLSTNQGTDWSKEIIIRDGGGDEDIGYTRNALLPDGRVMTIYYWNNHEKEERTIEATIWNPMDYLKD